MTIKKSEFFLPNDLIRAFAIVLVILNHASNTVQVNFFQTPVLWGVVSIFRSLFQAGVPLFVMLSGALLLTPSKVNEPLRVFFKERLVRILLPFLFWGLAYFAWRRFAEHEIITFDTILNGFSGFDQLPFSHFWFIYMIIGLYLITPVLRVLVSYASKKILLYSIILWFLGTAIIPLFGMKSILLNTDVSIILNSDFFVMAPYVGYFVLGAYLRNVKVDFRIVCPIFFVGLLWTSIGNCIVTVSAGATGYVQTIFGQYFYMSIILTSAALFLLLCAVPIERLEKSLPRCYSLVSRISQDSFAIYFLHLMVLIVLCQEWLFGFNLGIISLNPILEIPVLSLLTLIVSLGIIWLLRKVPMMNKAIGVSEGIVIEKAN